MDYFKGIIGLVVFMLVGYLVSNNRKAINWRLVGIGITLQIVFGLLIMKVPFVRDMFDAISTGFVRFLDFALDGSKFLFGDLANDKSSFGFIFAFQVLPTIIFFSTISAALYYLGILQKIVYAIAYVMSKAMGLSGPESLSAAGNIFLGQTEAPLLVKPFIKNMTKSELMCLMTGGMATIAGAILAAAVGVLGGADPVAKAKFASHLLSASIMSAPAAIVMAKIMIPETKDVNKSLELSKESLGVNLIDAMAIGAGDGLKLALNVGGMLLAFIAVIAMLNAGLVYIGDVLDVNQIIRVQTGGAFKALSMEYLLGQISRPFAYLMGVEWKDTLLVGSLIGQKTAVNEFVAYLDLSRMIKEGSLSEKSILVSTYALCGFSNFSSIAIQIGGISGMAPNQQGNLSKLGLRALLGATLACFMTATIAGAISG
ncbi:NupC/NupG family nucleoside CNT transporter [Microscilla marina]|uniref:Nucleoside transporter n=1 Tax=Microscilla marina ATCC 23134 TaxID=313606 RepID=A1ZHU3_MICM2|nr:nucleoside transporter C-terminal domain-containing protein [Microscilla marina]EAY30100.1 nucleoside transporter [Microscilla marina ATCC 23134]